MIKMMFQLQCQFLYNFIKQRLPMNSIAENWFKKRLGNLTKNNGPPHYGSPNRKDKRPISTLDFIGSRTDFQNYQGPYPQSTRNITSGNHMRDSGKYFGKKTEGGRLKTSENVNECFIPTARLPLKIRNKQEKNIAEVQDQERMIRTEYNFSKKDAYELENSGQPIYNKIIQKLTDKQKLINQLKQLASTQLPTRTKKKLNQVQKMNSLKGDFQLGGNKLSVKDIMLGKTGLKDTIRSVKEKNPENKNIKKGLYYTPKLTKATSNTDQIFDNSQSTLKTPFSPQLTKSSYSNNHDSFNTDCRSQRAFSSINVKDVVLPMKSEVKTSLKDFKLFRKLGEGKFGTAFAAIHMQSGAIFALKKIKKEVIKSHLMVDQMIIEIKIQGYCDSQNIVKLYDCFEDKQHVYLVLQYMQEGTLFEQLKKRGTLSESQAARRVNQVAQAVHYLHNNGIAHRDIKPENIVISNGVSKLCDFGWAAICTQRRRTYCGTFDYAAPQILEGSQYDMSVDMWCLGVLAFELLVGKAPFYHISRKQTMRKIKSVDDEVLSFPSGVSGEAVDFIQNLLKKNPQERMTAQLVLKHPFLSQAKTE